MSRTKRCAFHAAVLSVLAGPSFAVGQAGIEQWSLVEELRIGAIEGPAALTEPSALLVSADGRQVYVGQRRENLIRVFDALSGAPLRTIGRDGRGPGEFSWMGGMGWNHDTLYVTDLQAQSIAMFTPEGRHLRTIRVVSQPIPGSGAVAFPISMCQDGTVLGSTFSTQGTASIPTVAMTREGRVLVILAEVDARDSWFRIGNSGRAIVGVRPMGVDTEVTVAPDGCSVVVVHQPRSDGSASRFEVSRLRTNGEKIFQRQYLYTPRPLPKSVVDRIVADYGKRVEGAGAARVREMILEGMKLPPFQPPVSATLVGSDGSTWLRRGDDGTAMVGWSVLGADGVHLANVRAPAALKALAWDGRAFWATVRDELDVPYVVRYRVQRAPSR